MALLFWKSYLKFDSTKKETNMKILTIDDSPFTLKLHKKVIEELNHDAVTALGGAEGIRRFEESPDDFDIVICDILMPDVTGYDVIASIRKTKPDLPIITISADIQKSTQQMIADFGNTWFVKKPLKIENLSEAIDKLCK